MANFHINPETGDPGRCIAVKRCKYKADESQHFSTKDEARAAYEEKMSYDNLPKTVTNSQNLTRMAKDTAKRSDMKIILQYGSAYELSHLARNPNVPGEYLERIWEESDKANRENTKYIVALHPNCPITLLDKSRLIHLGNHSKLEHHGKKMQEVLESDDITDEQAEAIADRDFSGSEQILSNENNKVSQEVLRKLAFKNPSSLSVALETNRFDAESALKDESMSTKKIQGFQRSNITPEVRKFIYNHVNCPQEVKSQIEREYPELITKESASV